MNIYMINFFYLMQYFCRSYSCFHLANDSSVWNCILFLSLFKKTSVENDSRAEHYLLLNDESIFYNEFVSLMSKTGVEQYITFQNPLVVGSFIALITKIRSRRQQTSLLGELQTLVCLCGVNVKDKHHSHQHYAGFSYRDKSIEFIWAFSKSSCRAVPHEANV